MLFYAPCALRRELRYGNAASGRSCGCAPRVCPGIGCRPCHRKTDTPKHPSAIPFPSALPASSATPCSSAQPRLVGCFPSLSSPFPSRCRPFPVGPTGARRRPSAPTNLVPCSQKAPVSCPIRNNMQNIFGIKKRLLLSLQTDVVCQTEQTKQTKQTKQAEQTKRNVGQNKQGETRTHNPIRLQQ